MIFCSCSCILFCYVITWNKIILQIGIYGENIQMNKYKVLCIMFTIATCCFIVGTINHIMNTGEGILSSILLALGCLCMSFVFYKKK